MARTNKQREKKPKPLQFRFGIGEWYGTPLTALGVEERHRFAEVQFLTGEKPLFPCPFQREVACNKIGGVCSLRLYEKSPETEDVRPAPGVPGELRTVCPSRFEEDSTIYHWVGETVLGCSEPLILREIGFLESPPSEEIAAVPSDVGRIDKVLVAPGSKPLSWCALEVQAVYFQGRAMGFDFAIIRDHVGDALPFPKGRRKNKFTDWGRACSSKLVESCGE